MQRLPERRQIDLLMAADNAHIISRAILLNYNDGTFWMRLRNVATRRRASIKNVKTRKPTQEKSWTYSRNI